MKNNIVRFLLLFLSAGLIGCAGIQEAARVLWGSSTRALEEARADAITKTFRCSPQQAWEAVVVFVEDQVKSSETAALKQQSVPDLNRAIPEEEDTLTISKLESLQIFIKDQKRNLLVLMGIPGANNTTEVGIFFVEASDGVTRVEISSLSRQTKQKAAEIVFAALLEKFSAVDGRPAAVQVAP